MNLQKQKTIYLPKWHAAAKNEPCTWPGCGSDNGTTVAAHSNLLQHGKGIGKKSDSLYIAFLCADHHYTYDFGKDMPQQEKTLMFLLAMSKTWRRLYDKGLIVCR